MTYTVKMDVEDFNYPKHDYRNACFIEFRDEALFKSVVAKTMTALLADISFNKPIRVRFTTPYGIEEWKVQYGIVRLVTKRWNDHVRFSWLMNKVASVLYR